MSRYRIPAENPQHEVIIGWDDPLETYFATIFDTTVPDEADDAACLLWVGSSLGALPTVDALQACLQAYATIPEEVVAQLHHDAATTTPRTPLQERMVQLLARLRA